jgi:hypothetical protein
MMTRLILIVIGLSILFWGLGGNSFADTEKQVPAPVWRDIKKAPGPKVVPIPGQYSDLSKAFDEYWEAKKARDFKKAYGMEAGDYRKSTSFDLYKERLKGQVDIIAVRLLEVKPVNEKEVMVRASLGIKAGILDTVKLIHDRWVKEDAGWKHLPEEEKQAEDEA